MSLEKFRDYKFQDKTIALINKASDIIAEYQSNGYSLTLRQLYYQFVSRDLIPNNMREYKKLGETINKARLAGLIDWNAIEDRTRNLKGVSTWDGPEGVISSACYSYKEDLWRNQSFAPEVWIEKDALVGVIERVCNRWQVPFFACRGYTSQSEQYRAGKRLKSAEYGGKQPIILHLGDHDPSGIDMTRDNRERLDMFSGFSAEVRRLALNMDQIDQYSPPPNPAKITDSRFQGYVDKHGKSSWELDALDPSIIAELVEDNVKKLIDFNQWEIDKQAESDNKDMLYKVSDRWDEVCEFLEGTE